MKQVAVPSKA